MINSIHLVSTLTAALSALVLSACANAAPPADSNDWPNILFVFTDDQRWDTIHALGNPEIQTPNLDRLVDRGFRFNNAYCMGSMVGAVCLPSRTMLATGLSLWHIPNGRAKDAPPDVPILPELLKRAGYLTFHHGKAGNACTFANAAFDTTIESRSHGNPLDAKTHTDPAIEFIKERDGKQPFFIYLAPPVPHDPRVAPPDYMRMYDPAKLTLSKNFMPRHPFDNGDLWIRDEMLAPFPRPPEVMRRHLADYYAVCTYIDAQVGRLLETIKDRGMAGNTIVIFSSDQGLAVGGRHGLMGKQNLYEHVKPPLVLAGPGIPRGESEALVYLFDLFPTICGLAGAKTPGKVEGKSLLPIIRGEMDKVRDYLLGAYKATQRMVRDERWKLIKYHAGGQKNTQLFDLENDPDEVRNLAHDPAHAAQLARLEKLLDKARAEFDDPVDFEGAGGPVSQPWKSRPRKKAAKARPAG